MKALHLSFLWTLTSLITLSNTAMANDEDLVQQATFAENTQITNLKEKARSLGLITRDLSAWGVTYRQNLAPEYDFWVQSSHGGSRPVLLDHDQIKTFKGHASLEETDSNQILLGVDKRFHPTDNKTWGFIVGLGGGYNQSSYESTYYPPLCSWLFCGFDPNSGTVTKVHDNYGFLSARLGVVWRNVSVLARKGDISLFLSPNLIRWPNSFEILTPSEQKLNPTKKGFFVIESVIEI